MKDIFFNWPFIVSIMNPFDNIARSHNDIAFAFMFLRTVVISVTPLSNKLALSELLK
jgi:hypothetical protein